MPSIPFDRLPPHARLWIFAAERELSEPEQQRLLAETDAFIAQWTAHGLPLSAARELRHRRFLLVGVDETPASASGCSIDALVRRMQGLEAALGLELVNNAPVVFRDGQEIARVSREEFAELAQAGKVDLDTLVFDNTLTKVGDLLAGRWEVPARDAWHARAFF